MSSFSTYFDNSVLRKTVIIINFDKHSIIPFQNKPLFLLVNCSTSFEKAVGKGEITCN